MDNDFKQVIYEFGVKNYKIFDEFHWFEIQPITILTGPNSSGKSSLFKLIELIRDNFSSKIPYSLNTNESSDQILNFNKKLEPLEFRFKLFENKNKKVFINLSYDLNTGSPNPKYRLFEIQLIIDSTIIYKYLESHVGDENQGRDIPGKGMINYNGLKEVILLYLNLKIKTNKEVANFYAKHDKQLEPYFTNQFKRLTSVLEKNNQLFYLEHNDESLQGLIEPSFQEKFSQLEKEYKSKILDCAFEFQSHIDGHLLSKAYISHTFDGEIFSAMQVLINHKEKELINILSKEVEQLLGDFTVKLTVFGEYFFHEFWTSIMKGFTSKVSSFQHIQRIESQKSQYDEIFDIRNPKNLLAKAIRNYNDYQSDGSRRGDYFQEFKNKWLEKFEIGKDIEIDVWNDSYAKLKIIDFNDNKIDITNLGFGVGQVISLIMIPFIYLSDQENYKKVNHEASGHPYDKRNIKNVLVMEEPEINLHPNWQSLIMDLIVDVQEVFGVNFIVETHSEYMIRKLQYLTAHKDSKLKPEDSVIYYFNSPNTKLEKGDSQVKEITIDSAGNLSDNFGPGFYDEAINLKFDLLSLNKTQHN